MIVKQILLLLLSPFNFTAMAAHGLPLLKWRRSTGCSKTAEVKLKKWVMTMPITAFFLLMWGSVTEIKAFKFVDLFANSRFSAQVQGEAQYCFSDGTPESEAYSNQFLSHLYLDGAYNSDWLSLGVRFELYENPLPGFEPTFKGWGFPHFYLTVHQKGLSVTAGDFYEQFGSGMILRAYQERALGIDNALRGGRIIYSPLAGLRFKLLAGIPRSQWEWSKGVVGGIDAELDFSEWIRPLADKGHTLQLGGGFVSKYEADELIVVAPGKRLNLPLYVGAFSTRLTYQWKGFSFLGEYAWKANDPSSDNRFIYRHGEALLLSASYSQKGLGITLSAKHCDNMSFRSQRTATQNAYLINYLPALTRQHTYALAALYPYATQTNGEVAFQADVLYQIPKGTWLGGRYGMDLRMNFSHISALNKKYPQGVDTPIEGTYGYQTHLFDVGDEVYYRDFNIEISRKFNAKSRLTLMYMNQLYNDKIRGKSGMILSNIAVAEFQYRFSQKHSLRAELQYLTTQQDEKDWIAAVVEYSFSPHWIFTVTDLWNLSSGKNYPVASVAFIEGIHRLQLTGGLQREGYNCAGGICRYVPSTQGISFSYTANF